MEIPPTRNARACASKRVSCRWPKVDGEVVVPYEISTKYSKPHLFVCLLSLFFFLHTSKFHSINLALLTETPWSATAAEERTAAIKMAMKEIEQKTCVSFVEHSTERSYLTIESRSG